jgi:hypothetical protein
MDQPGLLTATGMPAVDGNLSFPLKVLKTNFPLISRILADP